MARETTTRTDTVTRTEVTATICDLCKTRFPGDAWNVGSYTVDETTIKREHGTQYPDCGDREYIEFDICPACFMNKLVPWLKSQGAEPRTTETSW